MASFGRITAQRIAWPAGATSTVSLMTFMDASNVSRPSPANPRLVGAAGAALRPTSMSEPSVVAVPYTTLSEAALDGLIGEFVTRAGTDYGRTEKTLAEKIADVRRQLERGEARIVFDPESETVNIVVTDAR